MQWTQDGVGRTWRAATFTPADGKVALGGNGYLYYVSAMHGQNPPQGESARQAYPARCPRCDVDWSRRQIGSPSTLRTGFQKIAQVLSDALLRDIARGSSQSQLVVFSDSRQDAAKLSAGMRFSITAMRCARRSPMQSQCKGGAQAFAAQFGDSRKRLSSKRFRVIRGYISWKQRAVHQRRTQLPPKRHLHRTGALVPGCSAAHSRARPRAFSLAKWQPMRPRSS
jgi:hypothetical protein